MSTSEKSPQKDPVCGMLVNPEQAAGLRVCQGRTYYFCSPGCVAKFDKAPEQYADQQNRAPD